MAQKYILNDGDLIMANVKFHREILGEGKNKNTIGGGYWYYDKQREMWFFYSKSEDFGRVTFDKFKTALLNNYDEDLIEAKKVFTTQEYLIDVFKFFDNNQFINFDIETNCHY